ncbi:MAG: PKD domain-containing protein [Planctomycetes bacterium]|nr:PKD domain-containing protein [Planctomycetota bacterium]
MSNPPTATASATPTSGTAPLTVSFTGTGTDDGSITKYEWDFDGNGVYDWSSNTGGNTVKAYSSAGTYTATLRVTDNDNLTGTASVTITVSSPPVEKKSPTASISASSTSGIAPLTVTFTYSGTDTDGTIQKHEMDFDGNGTYDFVSTSSGSISYIYGQGGSYTATLKVTDNDGLSGTASVTISVSNPTNTNPLVADANCSPSSVTVGEIVTLTGSAIGGSGSYIAYIWDYEGDGEYDWASTTGTTTHVYDKPGSYSPTVMVVDSNGLTDTDSVALTVSSPSNLKVWISVPKNGDSIWGTDVTLHANTAPGNLTKSVKFQYKGVTTDWTDIGSEMFPPPNSFFSTTWNVTGLTEGDYQLRAVGKDTSDNTVNSEIITVTVTQTNPDVNDGVDNSGNREKKQKIDKDETTESSMEDYTSVEIPYGTLTQDATLTVTALPANPQNTTEGANSSLDKFRKIELEGNPTLEKSVTVTIPYDDTDNNGIVDGTNIPEKDLKLWWYNTTTGKWEKISDTEVDTTNKQVKAKVGHLSDFAIGSEDTAAPSAPSGLSATAGDGQVSLTWTNPADTDFAGVKVIRKTGGYPASVTDGTEVYSGTGTSKTDTGLTNGTACYYTIFAYDEVPNYSTGAQSSATPQGSSGGGGGGGGGCFIATAAYGTPMASDVVTLSRFRDTHLLTNPIGKRLVAFYYRMSPPIADFIARHEYLRSMVRFILKPVVGLVN